jgi:archaellum component FlaC
MRFGSKDRPQFNTMFTRFHWLELAEYVATAASVVGTLVVIAGQNIAYVTTPLSLAIVLNLTNRQRLEKKHQLEHHLIKAHINSCYEDLSGQFPSRIPAEDINLSEIEEQIEDLQYSLSILENKSASLATKVYQNLSGELNVIREEMREISEPLDITNLENEIESLYAQIAAFANQPRLDSQHYQKF